MKKLLKSDFAVTCASAVATAYIWFVHKTTRWQRINDEVPMRLVDEGEPFIMAFWHGRLLQMAPLLPRKGKFSVMISQHGDGELIARSVKPFGIDSVRGSSSQGGAAAFKELLRVTKRKEVAIITPDGPRGPRMRAQDGIVAIAAMTGLPIIPVSFATTRMRLLNSWDRFALAKPFARGVMVWGDPIYVSRKNENGSHDDMKRVIEEKLTFVTQESDRLCGHNPVEPAPEVESSRTAKKAS